MTHLPALNDWDTTKDSLHRAAKAVSPFRKAFSPQQPNALHLALYIRDFGLTTGPLSFGRVDLHLASAVVNVTANGESWNVDLAGQSPQSLRAAVLDGLHRRGVAGDVPANDDSAPFEIDLTQAGEYGEALWRVSGALRQLRADWLGAVTPLVVWPHGFDASQVWFPGSDPDEATQPHLNFGFSPGSEGLPRPYIYATAWPMPAGLTGAALPPLARWHTQGWTGVVIDYDGLLASEMPVFDLAENLRAVYALLSGALKK